MAYEGPGGKKRRRRCSRCGELGALPVVYGMVIGMEPAEEEQVIFAGCVVPDDDPRNLCRPCAHAAGLR